MADALIEVLAPGLLLASFVGVLLGTLVGVLPGLGPSTTMALLIPITFELDPAAGLLMLAGVYYGSQYGGSTTGVLLNVPGEAGAEVTALEGYPMAQRGRAGGALAVAAIGSFFAGVVGLGALAWFGPALARWALAFGPPEYFAITALGLSLVFVIAGGDIPKAAAMGLLGMLLGTVGLDHLSGVGRYTFGSARLLDGISLVAVVMGAFGIAEVLDRARTRESSAGDYVGVRVRDLYATKRELGKSVSPILRGTSLGLGLGLLPGPSTVLACYASYAVEKRIKGRKLVRTAGATPADGLPETDFAFGEGAIEGVAGPESANNATVSGALVPLLSLGLPFSAPAAVLLAAFIVQGVRPGPRFIIDQPELFWALVVGMIVGNVMLLILNLPLVPVFASLLKIPMPYLLPVVVIIIVAGAYAIHYTMVEVWVAVLSGIAAWYFGRYGYPPAPLVLGLVLGPIAEVNFRQSLFLLGGDLTGFWTRPISAALLTVTVLAVVVPIVSAMRPSRRRSSENEEGT